MNDLDGSILNEFAPAQFGEQDITPPEPECHGCAAGVDHWHSITEHVPASAPQGEAEWWEWDESAPLGEGNTDE